MTKPWKEWLLIPWSVVWAVLIVIGVPVGIAMQFVAEKIFGFRSKAMSQDEALGESMKYCLWGGCITTLGAGALLWYLFSG